jgi:hypothetical protein
MAKEYEALSSSDDTVVASPSSSKWPTDEYDDAQTRLGSYDDENVKPQQQHLERLYSEDPLSPHPDYDEEVDFSEAEEKAVLKKLDRRVVLFVALLYLLSFLDRSNIGNARIAGLEKDLKLEGEQYEWLLTAFYISYIAFEWMALLCVEIPLESRVVWARQLLTSHAASD